MLTPVCGDGRSVAGPLSDVPPVTRMYFALTLTVPAVLSAELLDEFTNTPQLDALIVTVR